MLDSLYEIFSEKVSVDGENVLRERTSFCAGIDLAERRQRPSTGAISPVEKVFHAMEMNPLPIVSIVQGAAIAKDDEMALHSEFVVATGMAKFGMSLAQVGLHQLFLTKKLLRLQGLLTQGKYIAWRPIAILLMLNKGSLAVLLLTHTWSKS